jgi:hypothetical protein
MFTMTSSTERPMASAGFVVSVSTAVPAVSGEPFDCDCSVWRGNPGDVVGVCSEDHAAAYLDRVGVGVGVGVGEEVRSRGRLDEQRPDQPGKGAVGAAQEQAVRFLASQQGVERAASPATSVQLGQGDGGYDNVPPEPDGRRDCPATVRSPGWVGVRRALTASASRTTLTSGARTPVPPRQAARWWRGGRRADA